MQANPCAVRFAADAALLGAMRATTCVQPHRRASSNRATVRAVPIRQRLRTTLWAPRCAMSPARCTVATPSSVLPWSHAPKKQFARRRAASTRRACVAGRRRCRAVRPPGQVASITAWTHLHTAPPHGAVQSPHHPRGAAIGVGRHVRHTPFRAQPHRSVSIRTGACQFVPQIGHGTALISGHPTDQGRISQVSSPVLALSAQADLRVRPVTRSLDSRPGHSPFPR